MQRGRGSSSLLLRSFILVLLFAGAAMAAKTITVTSSSDAPGAANTLRQAILDAESGDTVKFSGAMTIQLNAEIIIGKDLTIDGDTNGDGFADVSIFSRSSRLFSTTSNVNSNDGYEVNFYRLRFTEGVTTEFGGILQTGKSDEVHVERCYFSGGAASLGGAIDNDGNLTVIESEFDGNNATNGGAISFKGETKIYRSLFYHNRASKGSAIFRLDKPLIVEDSTFLANDGSSLLYGGGVLNRCTLKDLDDELFAANGQGWSVFSSILDGRVGISISLPASGFQSLGYNIFTNTNATVGATDLVTSSESLKLGQLTNNGGPTRTLALGSSSVALERGDPNFSCSADSGCFDQRGAGFERLSHERIDAGAFEIQVPSLSPTASLSISSSTSATAEPSVSSSVSVTAQPSISSSASVTAQPSISSSVSVTAQPSITSEPSVSSEPSLTREPSLTSKSSVTSEPSLTSKPSATSEPSRTPSVTRVPSSTSQPSTSSKASRTSEPSATGQPSASSKPSTTSQPSNTPEPPSPSPSNNLPQCGNGIVDKGEKCDPLTSDGQINPCCTSKCKFARLGTVCKKGERPCIRGGFCNARGKCIELKRRVTCLIRVNGFWKLGKCDKEQNACIYKHQFYFDFDDDDDDDHFHHDDDDDDDDHDHLDHGDVFDDVDDVDNDNNNDNDNDDDDHKHNKHKDKKKKKKEDKKKDDKKDKKKKDKKKDSKEKEKKDNKDSKDKKSKH